MTNELKERYYVLYYHDDGEFIKYYHKEFDTLEKAKKNAEACHCTCATVIKGVQIAEY